MVLEFLVASTNILFALGQRAIVNFQPKFNILCNHYWKIQPMFKPISQFVPDTCTLWLRCLKRGQSSPQIHCSLDIVKEVNVYHCQLYQESSSWLYFFDNGIRPHQCLDTMCLYSGVVQEVVLHSKQRNHVVKTILKAL